MSNDTKTYNGWTNYETWCVHLWLTNDEGSYHYWREEAGRHLKDDREDARCNLAKQLKSELEEASPLEEASLSSDLLNAALSEVDWYEVADAFLEDLEPDSDTEGEGEETDLDEENERETFSLEDFERTKRERAESPTGPLFELGRVVSTPGALAALSREDIENALRRHHRGDWGDIGRSDWGENESSLKEGFRLFSVYHSRKGETFWVITEADRSSTCVLLPSEYWDTGRESALGSLPQLYPYNGWANYETWCVHLWISNEEGSYRYWREEAERHRDEAPNDSNVKRNILSVEEAARYTLGEAIKESFETFHPFRGEHLAKPMEAGVFGDLLDSALSEVQWCDIADAFLEDL